MHEIDEFGKQNLKASEEEIMRIVGH